MLWMVRPRAILLPDAGGGKARARPGAGLTFGAPHTEQHIRTGGRDRIHGVSPTGVLQRKIPATWEAGQSRQGRVPEGGAAIRISTFFWCFLMVIGSSATIVRDCRGRAVPRSGEVGSKAPGWGGVVIQGPRADPIGGPSETVSASRGRARRARRFPVPEGGITARISPRKGAKIP
jgi:hypothetical protein